MEEECKKATEKAMNLLLRQDRTKKELEERLYRAGFSEKAIEHAMEYVMSFGYIDDRRFASTYIAFHKGNRSRKELRYRLLEKGVPKEIIGEVLLEYEETDEKEALQNMLRKRLKGKRLSGMEWSEKEKIIAYLGRKGYPISQIKIVLQEWEENQENCAEYME